MKNLNIFELMYPEYKITKPIRLIELFAGIGSQAKALKNIGANFETYRVVEFDKYAIASYNAVHGTNFPTVDITQIKAQDLNIVDTNKYDYILTYSFPCQDLSLAGKRKGMEKDTGTRSGLLWEVERLLTECTELPQILVMENVPQIHSKENIKDFRKWISFLENLGYSSYYEDLNAKDFGIPQNRNRTFMVSILGEYYYDFPRKIKLEKRLKDLLEDNVDEKFYLSDDKIERVSNWGGYENPFSDIERDRICSTITTHCGKDSNGMQLVKEEKDEYMKNTLCNKLVESGVVKENDVINHSYTNGLNGKNPNSRQNLEDYIETQDNSSPTLTTRPDCLGVVVKVGNYSPSGHNASSIVDSQGLAPTVMENHGTVTAIVEQGVLIPEKTKKGYAEANDGDGVYINRPHQKRGCVQKDMIQTIKANCTDIGVVVEDTPKLIGGVGEMKSNNGTQFYQQDRIYSGDGIAMCHPANLPGGSYNYAFKEIEVADGKNMKFKKQDYCGTLLTNSNFTGCGVQIIKNELRIRKLTPKECWRLMGFDDGSYERAEKVNSAAQLYKQAGNSIVVNVLEAIFSKLL